MIARHLPFAVLLLLTAWSAHAQSSARTPVVVELFTSEGCSSCPPADALLARLDRDQPIPSAEVIVLGEHVDYWDSLGWRDRFSSHRFTERQSGYGARFHLADVYTPQMVVAGRAQLNGADAGAAARAIVKAAQTPGLPLVLSEPKIEGKHLTASVSLPGGSNPGVELFAAVVSPLETTAVRSGENGGHTLHHAGVVRSLMRVGNTRDSPLQIRLELPSAAQPLRLVVFAQSAELGPILGAVSIAVPTISPEAVARAGK